LTGGRHWLQMPIQESQTANFGEANPAALLAVLDQQGNTVRPLGLRAVVGERGAAGHSEHAAARGV
jgi:hypothetical protein